MLYGISSRPCGGGIENYSDSPSPRLWIEDFLTVHAGLGLDLSGMKIRIELRLLSALKSKLPKMKKITKHADDYDLRYMHRYKLN